MRPSRRAISYGAPGLRSRGVELLAVVSVQRGARLRRVVQRDPPGPIERSALGDANERPVLRTARERPAHERILLRPEDQWQRRRAVAQVGARNLARLDRLTGAVENV